MELYQYLDLSKKVIMKHGNMKMMRSEDAISYVANFLMQADHKYNPSVGTKEGFMAMWGKFGVMNWVNKYQKKKAINLESISDSFSSTESTLDNVMLNEVLNEIDTLDERQKNCIMLYFWEGKTLREISEIYDLSKERIRQIIEGGLKIIRRKFEDEPSYADSIQP